MDEPRIAITIPAEYAHRYDIGKTISLDCVVTEVAPLEEGEVEVTMRVDNIDDY